jgi:hypothetical protein
MNTPTDLPQPHSALAELAGHLQPANAPGLRPVGLIAWAPRDPQPIYLCLLAPLVPPMASESSSTDPVSATPPAEWVRVATLQVLHAHLPLGLVLRDPTGTLAAATWPALLQVARLSGTGVDRQLRPALDAVLATRPARANPQ